MTVIGTHKEYAPHKPEDGAALYRSVNKRGGGVLSESNDQKMSV